MSGWMPIETAPRGTPILVYSRVDGITSIKVTDEVWNIGGFGEGAILRNVTCYRLLVPGWPADADDTVESPTHWMALPEPPQ